MQTPAQPAHENRANARLHAPVIPAGTGAACTQIHDWSCHDDAPGARAAKPASGGARPNPAGHKTSPGKKQSSPRVPSRPVTNGKAAQPIAAPRVTKRREETRGLLSASPTALRHSQTSIPEPTEAQTSVENYSSALRNVKNNPQNCIAEYSNAAPDIHRTIAEYSNTAPDILRTNAECRNAEPDIHRTIAEYSNAAPDIHRTFAEYSNAAPDIRRTIAELTLPNT